MGRKISTVSEVTVADDSHNHTHSTLPTDILVDDDAAELTGGGGVIRRNCLDYDS